MTPTNPDHVAAAIEALEPWIRTEFARLPKQEALTKLCDDIWATDKPVFPHTDNTKDDLITYGLVLLNEMGLELHYEGGIFPLGIGDVYCIDGRKTHAALPTAVDHPKGLFAAKIWDMPRGQSLASFKSEALASIRALAAAKGESVGRDEVIEECAKVVDHYADTFQRNIQTPGTEIDRSFESMVRACASIAPSIRGLKSTPPESPSPSQPPDLGREAVIEEVLALIKGCQHDMGFDRQLGPLGCALEAEGRGGCVCAGIHAQVRALTDKPWLRCPSTHCERAGECRSPSECCVRALSAAPGEA